MWRSLPLLLLVVTGCGTTSETPIPEPEKHRAVAEQCDDVRDPGPDLSGTTNGCTSDAECTDGSNGRCVPEPRSDSAYCTYDECATDTDCGAEALCSCAEGTAGANVCLPGNCRIDADCGDSNYCSPTLGECGTYAGVVAYYCHTADDECSDDADCGGGFCAYDAGVGHWACSSVVCVG